MTSAQIAIMTTIILYLCLVIFTGVMIGKRSKKSAEGFYLGGRGMGPLVTAMSAEASDMSSYLLMGIPGLAYLSGVADASWTAMEKLWDGNHQYADADLCNTAKWSRGGL